MSKYADGTRNNISKMKMKPKMLAQVDLSNEIGHIDDIIAGYQAGHALAAALELGLFDWLQKHSPSGREEISRALKINGMFTKSYLQALIDMGLLAIADKKYANTPLASKYLSGNSEHYQGDYLLSVMGKGSKWGDLKTTITLKDPLHGVRQ